MSDEFYTLILIVWFLGWIGATVAIHDLGWEKGVTVAFLALLWPFIIIPLTVYRAFGGDMDKHHVRD